MGDPPGRPPRAKMGCHPLTHAMRGVVRDHVVTAVRIVGGRLAEPCTLDALARKSISHAPQFARSMRRSDSARWRTCAADLADGEAVHLTRRPADDAVVSWSRSTVSIPTSSALVVCHHVAGRSICWLASRG